MEEKSSGFVKHMKSLLLQEYQAEREENEILLHTYSRRQLESRGVCLTKMNIYKISKGHFGKTLLHLHKAGASEDDELPNHKFSSGDLAGLFSGSTSVPIESGIISKATRLKIILTVSELKTETEEIMNRNCALIMLPNEVTYTRNMQALEAFESSVKEPETLKLREVITGRLKPQFQKTTDIDGIIFYNKNLNQSQKQAVEMCLTNSEIAIIHGPPGTGKTTTVVEAIFQIASRGEKVLATAGSNIAVDNMLEKLDSYKSSLKLVRLGHPARVLEHISHYSLDAQLKSECDDVLTHIRKEIKQLQSTQRKESKSKQKYSIQREINALEKDLRKAQEKYIYQILNSSNIIFATTTGAGDNLLKRAMKFWKRKYFDCVIVDECAQSIEPNCWIPLNMGAKAILAGDHKQLEPTIKSQQAIKGGLANTLFEKLMNSLPRSCATLLNIQYRMNTKIMDWSSKTFYESKLIADSSVAQHSLKDRGLETDFTHECILVIDTAGCQMYESRDEGSFLNQSKFNIGEADLVKLIVSHLLNLEEINPADIGVIAPYNAQVSFLRELIHNRKVEISTVDGFQGRQKQIIILSMVRSNLDKKVGFLANERRLNVAVTRARRFLCLIGDCSTLESNEILASLIEHCQSKGEIKSALEFRDNPDVRFGEGNAAVSEQKKEMAKTKQHEKQYLTKNQKKKQKKKKQEEEIEQADSKKEKKKHEKKEERLERQEQQLIQLFNQIRDFIQNEAEIQFKLPQSINAYQRMKIHQFCESKDLIHQSKGVGPQRALHLRKKEIQRKEESEEEEDKQEQEEKGHQTQKKESGQAAQGQKKKKKKKQKKEKQEVESKVMLSPQQEDEAALKMLQELVEESKRCFIKGCQKSVQMMGRQVLSIFRICPYCKKKFCFTHIIPQIHGCGKEAAKSAYEAQKKVYQDSQHSKVSLQKRKQTKEVIAKKIQEMKDARSKKVQEKKKK